MRVISILSTKGGVGKTFIVSNLAYKLSTFGYKVVAIDANFTTPHLASYLGYDLAKNTLHKLLKNQVELKDVLYPHYLGFRIIPGSLNLQDLTDLNVENLDEIIKKLDADFVLLDCAPGLGKEAMIGLKSGEEVLIVTIPELPTIIDALKTLKLARSLDKKILGIVLNRIKKDSFEVEKNKIMEILNSQVLAEIPEDKNVLKSINLKIPLTYLNSNSPAAYEIEKLAYRIIGQPWVERKISLVDRIINWLSR